MQSATIERVFQNFIRVVPEAQVNEEAKATRDTIDQQLNDHYKNGSEMSKQDKRNLGYYDHSPHFKQCSMFAGDINVVTRVGPYSEAKNFSDIDMSLHHMGAEYQIVDQKHYFGTSRNFTNGSVGGGTSSGACDFSGNELKTYSFPSSEESKEMKKLPSVFYTACALTSADVKTGSPLCLMIHQDTTRLVVRYKSMVLVDLDEIGLNLFKENTLGIFPYRVYWNHCGHYNQPIMLTIGKIDKEDFLKHAYIGVKIKDVKIKDVKEASFIDGEIDYYVISKPAETFTKVERAVESKSGSEIMQKFTETADFGKWLMKGDTSVLPKELFDHEKIDASSQAV